MTAVYIYVPAFGEMVSTRTFKSVCQLLPALSQKGIGGALSSFSFPNIADSRNMALSIWYDAIPDCSHLLFVDADIGFPPELVLDMLAFNEPLVGGMYRKRQDKVEWAASGIEGPQRENRGPFMELEGLGMGCFLIRRDAITKMIEHFPELVIDDISRHSLGTMLEAGGASRLLRFFDQMDVGALGAVSEDIAFCKRWRETGGKVWGAGHYVMEHVGPYIFAGCWAEWWMKAGQHEHAVQTQGQAVLEALDNAGA